MVPDYTYFLSYHPSMEPSGNTILGDNTNSNISGRGTTTVELNIQIILIWYVLHVYTLKVPL